MTAPSVLQRLLARIEEPAQPYGGRGETALAVAMLPLAFVYKVLDCLYGKPPLPVQSWPYIALLSAFTAVAFSSVLFLATPAGERQVRRLLAENRASFLAALPVLVVGLFLLILWGAGLPELQSHALARIAGLASLLPLPVFPPVFLAAAGLLLYGGFLGGLKLAMRNAAAAQEPRSFGGRDLLSVLPAILPFLLLQELLPLLWCFTTPVAVVVMVYATGLGREYFGYSFVPRSAKGALGVVLLLAAGLLLFLLTSWMTGQVRYTGTLWRTSWKGIYDSVFVWLLIVGISEEVIFRCGLLTLTAAFFARRKACALFAGRPRLSAVVFTSLLFGAAHFPHGFFFSYLAILAGLLYGLSFVLGKSLFGPVLLHGLLNVLVLMNFRLPG